MAAIADADAPRSAGSAASGAASIAASSSDAVHAVHADQGARAAGRLPPVSSTVKPTTSGCLPDWKMYTFMAASLAWLPDGMGVTVPAHQRETARSRRAGGAPFPGGAASLGCAAAA